MPLKNEQEWYERIRKDEHAVHFAIEDRRARRFIGICSLVSIHTVNRTATFGIMVGDKRYWNKGFGTEAARLCLAYAFDTLNLHRITSWAVAYNERSLRMHEKLGFKREGIRREEVYRKGRYWDVVHFGLLPGELKR